MRISKLTFASILLLIISLIGVDGILLNTNKQLASDNEVHISQIQHQEYQLSNMSFLLKIKSNALVESLINSISLGFDKNQSYNVLYLPYNKCLPCWESNMNQIVAANLRQVGNLYIITNNQNRTDVSYTLKKFNLPEKFYQLEQENELSSILDRENSTLLVLNNMGVASLIRLDLNNLEDVLSQINNL